MMKRPFLLFLPFLLFIAGAFVACEEVEEPGIYANWQQRNEAFIDSIKAATGDNIVATIEQADKMELGKLYAIQAPTSTGTNPQYIYCKKLVANIEGERPMYTGYHSVVSAYFRGTYITGDNLLKNFDGYGALDQEIPIPPTKEPSPFDSPVSFAVTNSQYVVGVTWPLQHMHKGERWMFYIPWQARSNGSSDLSQTTQTILAYSAITYDLILEDLLE